MLNALTVMLGIVVPVIVLTAAFAWWFRAGNARARRRPTWAYSGKLELLVWSVPLLVVIFVAGIGWVGSHRLDPMRPLPGPAPLTVQVIATDWKWLFVYPDQGVASVQRLVIPAGRPIRFRLTSATVMNSFFVPQLGSQLYAMAGMESTLHLQADRPGRYRGLSAHYSGAGFPTMAFTVDAVPADAFAGWVARTRTAGPVLDARAYRALVARRASSPAFTYRAVAPGLFDAAVREAGAPVAAVAHDGRVEGTPE